MTSGALKKAVVFTVQLATVKMQEEIVNSQCIDFLKMKEDAENGYKIMR